MSTVEKICQHLQKLPESLHSEVLDFVEYLVLKAEREAVRREASEWSYLSLGLAMHDIEDDYVPLYSTEDLKEIFS